MSKVYKPANDHCVPRESDKQGHCPNCECEFYRVVMRDGLHYVVCAQCDCDVTTDVIWGKEPLN